MASSSEETATRMYELEVQRIDAERRRRRKRIMWILGGVAAGMFVISGIVLSNAGHTSEWQMLDPPVGATIAISMVLAAIVAIVIARKANDTQAIMLFVAILAVGSMSFGVVGFGYFSGANAWFDDSPAQTHRVTVHDRLRARSSKSLVGRKRLVVESWRASAARETVYVTDAVHDADPSVVIVTTHAGFFGFTWIEDVAVVDR